MMRSRIRLASSLLIALGVVAGASGTAVARSAYDGIWSVVVAAEAGSCSGAYRVAIINGYVRHADRGDQAFNICGRVDSGGHVSVRVSRGDQSAYGVGRLSRVAGRGS